MSVGPGGVPGNAGSGFPAISADGRFVAFTSSASNLVAGDTNNLPDIFVRDREKGTTERVSLGPGGGQGNLHSFEPAISADGRFVAFTSDASNLVAGDTNGSQDVFVRDRVAGTTRRVSLGRGGQGNRSSFEPAISADGRFVAFASAASNLVAGDTNGTGDIFVRDRHTNTTRRVNLGPGGAQANSGSGSGGSAEPAISADGRFVAFTSDATNLVPADTNDGPDIFVRDRKLGTTRRVSRGPGGVQGNLHSFEPAISADGQFVVFVSYATNLVPGDTNNTADVFVRDRRLGTTSRANLAPGGVQSRGGAGYPAISADGQHVAFAAVVDDLVVGDGNEEVDVFVRNRRTGTTRRVSLGPSGAEGDDNSDRSSISADGRFVAFQSIATNLVPGGDTNGEFDVFVRGPAP